MAGRTPREAVNNFLEPLQRMVSCVTNAVLVVSPMGYQIGDLSHQVYFGVGNPVNLRGDSHLKLSILHHYRIVQDPHPDYGPWMTSTVAYYYTLEDANGQEVIGYHWHPQSEYRQPHLHIGYGARIGLPYFSKAHLPTGRVSLKEVLRLAITDFAVQPLRADWNEVLQQG